MYQNGYVPVKLHRNRGDATGSYDPYEAIELGGVPLDGAGCEQVV